MHKLYEVINPYELSLFRDKFCYDNLTDSDVNKIGLLSDYRPYKKYIRSITIFRKKGELTIIKFTDEWFIILNLFNKEEWYIKCDTVQGVIDYINKN